MNVTGIPETHEEGRTVRVFLSSTFRDMHGERDELARTTFPALQRRFRERGVELMGVDLRWGVTEEDVTVEVCLAEVDRCTPWFVGLLGQRYGTVLTPDAATDALRDAFPVLRGAEGCSLTEIEIRQGVLVSPQGLPRALFFERDAAWLATLTPGQRVDFEDTSPDARVRLERLKARIREVAAVHPYSTPQDIGPALEAALGAALEARFPGVDAPDVFSASGRLHAAYARDRLGLYIGGEAYLGQTGRLRDEAGPPLLITGASGGGKSTLIAQTLQAWHARHPRDIVFAHYLGASPDSADPMRLMRRLWEHLNRATGDTVALPAGEAGLMELAAGLAGRLAAAAAWTEASGVRIVIALDGLDKLSSEANLRWLPTTLPPPVTLIASSLEGEARDAALERGWRPLEVQPLDDAGRRELISATLRSWGRRLSLPRLDRILACPLAGLPLFLKTLLDELRVSATEDVFDGRLGDYLQARDMPALFAKVLARLEQDCGEPLVRRALSLVWAGRAGLEEAEILALTGATPLSWAKLRNGLGEALRDQAGRIAFGHDFLRTAVDARYLGGEEARRAAHRALAGRFEARGPDARKAEELPYQLSHGEEWGRLEAFLLDLDLLVLQRERGDRELLGYWLQLREQGRDAETLLCDAHERRAGEPGEWQQEDITLAFLVTGFLRYSGAMGDRLLRLARRLALACERAHGAGYIDTLASRNNLANLLSDRNEIGEAQTLREEVLAAYTRVLGPDHPDTLTSMGNLARVLSAKGDLEGAQELETRVLAARTRILGGDHPDTLTNLSNLALTCFDRGDFEEAQRLEEQALRERTRVLGPEHADTLASLNNLARTLHTRGDLEDARRLEERVLEARKRLLGPEHPDTLLSMGNLARTLADAGDLDAAQPLEEHALQVRTRVLGPTHPDTLAGMNNLAGILRARGELAAAQALQARVLEAQMRLLGPSHPDTLTSKNNLAATLYYQGDLAGAQRLQEDVLRERVQLLGPEHPSTLSSMGNLAGILAEQGDLAGARTLEEQVLEARRRLLGPEHPETLIAMGNLARSLFDAGDLAGAQTLEEQVLEARARLLGPDHPDTLTAIDNLERTLAARGDAAGEEHEKPESR